MTVYFNGLGSTRQQGLRYTNEVVTLDEDGKVLYRAANEPLITPIIHNVMPATEFNDVDLLHVGSGVVREEYRGRRWYHFWVDWPVYRDDHVVFLPHMSRPLLMGGPPQIQKGCDDVRRALDWKKENPKRKVVIYGASRGAGIAYLVTANLTKDEQSEVDLVVCEAPYDSVPNVLADRVGYPFVAWLLSWFPLYSAPLDVSFPVSIPIVIGSGTDDEACPIQGQHRLVQKLRDAGHPDVTHVVVEGVDHNNIFLSKEWKRTVREKHRQIFETQ